MVDDLRLGEAKELCEARIRLDDASLYQDCSSIKCRRQEPLVAGHDGAHGLLAFLALGCLVSTDVEDQADSKEQKNLGAHHLELLFSVEPQVQPCVGEKAESGHGGGGLADGAGAWGC